ncbi:MAG: hypothetical protein JSR59_05445 [Proteobacteria bacterium]|nr:hypothetical protein [Pseudomonadota bacterium]
MALITQRVELAHAGNNPYVIRRMRSGWAVIGDVQFLPGYSLLLPDPVVPSLNDLDKAQRALYLEDMGLLGDAVLRVTKAARINYEILGNSEPELHAHIFPRLSHEPPELRTKPAWFYDWSDAVRYDPAVHGHWRSALEAALAQA